ncbi:GIY-YIG nuclease family protein [Enterococcus hirae]|uniref:GIY-YIG nuclease family protein n=1 Tax=Enterococcus hirae TaxID=1354 RepID=UPI0013682C79|nr:GIY-YIG nuclease family protein [Enterococcus hirae]NAE18229.1 hypothetical protein [Enterococcus hirae]
MSGGGGKAVHYGLTDQSGKPHYVYRHYSPDGELLYVGCTSNPKQRPYVTRERPWFDLVKTRVVIDGPYEWIEALEIEAATIQAGRPVHNKRKNNGSRYRRFVVEEQLRRGDRVADDVTDEAREEMEAEWM